MKKLSLICSLIGLVAIYAAALRASPTIVPIADLDERFVGSMVTVSGRVVDYNEHRDGHVFLKLEDESGGTIDVPIFDRVRSGLKEPIELLDVVWVTGEARLYRNELEIVPERADQIRIIHTAPVRIRSLTKENVGELAKVQGTVTEVRRIGEGNLLLKLSEDGFSLPIFIPAWVVGDELPEIRVGYVVRVGGLLQIYDGELEIKIARAEHLRIVGTA